MTTRTRAELQVACAAVLFSTGGAAIKACALNGWQVASFRSGIAAAVLLLALPAARRGWNRATLAVAAAYAATLVLFVTANKLTTSAHAIFLQSSAPLYLLLIGPFLLGERLFRHDLAIMLLVGLGGVLLLTSAPQPQVTAPHPEAGNVLAAAAGLSWALTLAGLRWLRRGVLAGSPPNSPPGRATDPGIAAVAAGNVIAFAVTLPAALPVQSATAGDWAVLVYLGVIQIGLAYIFLTAGLTHLSALQASLLLLIEPVANPIWAAVIHHEHAGTAAWLGGAVILSATVLKTAASRRAT